MRFIGESKALAQLEEIISNLKFEISEKYEHRAKSCGTCKTQGSCCLDAHFVNVRISRLEAVAIKRSLGRLSPQKQQEINVRIDAAITKYSLTEAGDTFACPLFEKGIGCLVHNDGKPVPCIVHACYESAEHLPPDELQTKAEQRIDDLNIRAYGKSLPLLPLPVALRTPVS
jgi:hypothetical protein